MKAGNSTLETLSAKCSSPRLVIYTTDEVIASAFVIAGEKIWIKVPSPNLAKSLACLFASYFVWHIQYPAAYRWTLSYLDQEIFDTKNHKLTAVHKFTRLVENSSSKIWSIKPAAS